MNSGTGPRRMSALLRLAIRQGIESAVRPLVRTAEDANSVDRDGTPALVLAARSGHPGICRLLIDAGADPEAADPNCVRAATAAISGDRADIGKSLASGLPVVSRDRRNVEVGELVMPERAELPEAPFFSAADAASGSGRGVQAADPGMIGQMSHRNGADNPMGSPDPAEPMALAPAVEVVSRHAFEVGFAEMHGERQSPPGPPDDMQGQPLSVDRHHIEACSPGGPADDESDDDFDDWEEEETTSAALSSLEDDARLRRSAGAIQTRMNLGAASEGPSDWDEVGVSLPGRDEPGIGSSDPREGGWPATPGSSGAGEGAVRAMLQSADEDETDSSSASTRDRVLSTLAYSLARNCIDQSTVQSVARWVSQGGVSTDLVEFFGEWGLRVGNDPMIVGSISPSSAQRMYGEAELVLDRLLGSAGAANAAGAFCEAELENLADLRQQEFRDLVSSPSTWPVVRTWLKDAEAGREPLGKWVVARTDAELEAACRHLVGLLGKSDSLLAARKTRVARRLKSEAVSDKDEKACQFRLAALHLSCRGLHLTSRGLSRLRHAAAALNARYDDVLGRLEQRASRVGVPQTDFRHVVEGREIERSLAEVLSSLRSSRWQKLMHVFGDAIRADLDCLRRLALEHGMTPGEARALVRRVNASRTGQAAAMEMIQARCRRLVRQEAARHSDSRVDPELLMEAGELGVERAVRRQLAGADIKFEDRVARRIASAIEREVQGQA